MLRALMFILPLALTIYAFIDCLNTPEDEVKHLPKVVWVIIILLFWIVGPIVWIVAGKARRAAAGGARGSGRGGRGGRGAWVAPDDNPEFLKSLSEDSEEKKRQDDALFKDWEADLRRREDELKRQEGREEGDDKES
ncbi:PLDc_N domain-containing protein [Streptomyces sp. R302]|uniref:PLD nuclease N-terminal domain-containing protein n=1 Tax=unclassified Streptomyces TaxID=2593676 RepID=UPI00145F2F8D|nr:MULTISPECIES: PLD nuclease N-terminal domain-containing protein [unclassified Streptomyces]NML54910.1 PLDc_N domain-containing protein [Streptomyces sp. R301]NML83597.1 PLDc_N domain-containing protein [Streptomyces sp. R302]